MTMNTISIRRTLSESFIEKHFFSFILLISLLALVPFYVFDREMFRAVYAEYLAGLLGIVVGYGLSRGRETKLQRSKTKQILESIREELQYNLGLIETIIDDIEEKSYAFDLLKVTTWEIFKERLDVIENIHLLERMGLLYHEFLSTNEAIKQEGLTNALEAHFGENVPKGLSSIQEWISEVIRAIDQETGSTAKKIER